MEYNPAVLFQTTIIFLNDSWLNSEVEPADDILLPDDALSSLTICLVGW